jgi:hypothetical protein
MQRYPRPGQRIRNETTEIAATNIGHNDHAALTFFSFDFFRRPCDLDSCHLAQRDCSPLGAWSVTLPIAFRIRSVSFRQAQSDGVSLLPVYDLGNDGARRARFDGFFHVSQTLSWILAGQ